MSKKARLSYTINLPIVKSVTLKLTNNSKNEIDTVFRDGAALGNINLGTYPAIGSVGLLSSGLSAPVKIKIKQTVLINRPQVIATKVTTSPSRPVIGVYNLSQQPYLGTSSTYIDSNNQVQPSVLGKAFSELAGSGDGVVAAALKIATAKVMMGNTIANLSGKPIVSSFLQTAFPLVKTAEILAAIFFYTETALSKGKVTSKIEEFRVIKNLLSTPQVASLVSKGITRDNEFSNVVLKSAKPNVQGSPVKVGLADLVDEQTFHTISSVRNLNLSASSKVHFTFGRSITTDAILKSSAITGTNLKNNATITSTPWLDPFQKSTLASKSFLSKVYKLRKDIPSTERFFITDELFQNDVWSTPTGIQSISATSSSGTSASSGTASNVFTGNTPSTAGTWKQGETRLSLFNSITYRIETSGNKLKGTLFYKEQGVDTLVPLYSGGAGYARSPATFESDSNTGTIANGNWVTFSNLSANQTESASTLSGITTRISLIRLESTGHSWPFTAGQYTDPGISLDLDGKTGPTILHRQSDHGEGFDITQSPQFSIYWEYNNDYTIFKNQAWKIANSYFINNFTLTVGTHPEDLQRPTSNPLAATFITGLPGNETRLYSRSFDEIRPIVTKIANTSITSKVTPGRNLQSSFNIFSDNKISWFPTFKAFIKPTDIAFKLATLGTKNLNTSLSLKTTKRPIKHIKLSTETVETILKDVSFFRSNKLELTPKDIKFFSSSKTSNLDSVSKAIPGYFKTLNLNVKEIKTLKFNKNQNSHTVIQQKEKEFLKLFSANKSQLLKLDSLVHKGVTFQFMLLRQYSLPFKKPMLAKSSSTSITATPWLDPFQKSTMSTKEEAWKGLVHKNNATITSTPWLDPFQKSTSSISEEVTKFYRANKTGIKFGLTSTNSNLIKGSTQLDTLARVFFIRTKRPMLAKSSTIELDDFITKFYRANKKAKVFIQSKPFIGPTINNNAKTVQIITKLPMLAKTSNVDISEKTEKFYRANKFAATLILSSVAKGPRATELLDIKVKSSKKFNKNEKNSFVSFHPAVEEGVKTKVLQTSSISLNPNATSSIKVNISDPLALDFDADVVSSQVDYRRPGVGNQLMPAGAGGIHIQLPQGGIPTSQGRSKNIISYHQQTSRNLNFTVSSWLLGGNLLTNLRDYASYTDGDSFNNFKDPTPPVNLARRQFRREYTITLEYSTASFTPSATTQKMWSRVFIPTSETTSTVLTFDSERKQFKPFYPFHYTNAVDILWGSIGYISGGYLRPKTRVHTPYPLQHQNDPSGRGLTTLTFETTELYYVEEAQPFITNSGHSWSRQEIVANKTFLAEDGGLSEYDTLEIPFSSVTGTGYESFTVTNGAGITTQKDIVIPQTVAPETYTELLNKIATSLQSAGGVVTTTQTIDRWILTYKYPNEINLSDARLVNDTNIQTYESSKFLDTTNFIEQDSLLIPLIDLNGSKVYTVINSEGANTELTYHSRGLEILNALNASNNSTTVSRINGNNIEFITTYNESLSPTDPRVIAGDIFQTDGPLTTLKSKTNILSNIIRTSTQTINSNKFFRGKLFNVKTGIISVSPSKVMISAPKETESKIKSFDVHTPIKNILNIPSVKSLPIKGLLQKPIIRFTSFPSKHLELDLIKKDEGPRQGSRFGINGLDKLFFSQFGRAFLTEEVVSRATPAWAVLPLVKVDTKEIINNFITLGNKTEDLYFASFPEKLLDNKNPLNASTKSLPFPAYAVLPKMSAKINQDFFFVFKRKDLKPLLASTASIISNRPIKIITNESGLISNTIVGRHQKSTSSTKSFLSNFVKKPVKFSRAYIYQEKHIFFVKKPIKNDKATAISLLIKGKNVKQSLVGLGRLTEFTKLLTKNRESNTKIQSFKLINDIILNKSSSVNAISSKDLVRGTIVKNVGQIIFHKQFFDIIKHTQNQLSLASPERLIMDMKLKLPEDLANLADSGSLFNQSYSHAYFMEGYVGEERLF